MIERRAKRGVAFGILLGALAFVAPIALAQSPDPAAPKDTKPHAIVFGSSDISADLANSAADRLSNRSSIQVDLPEGALQNDQRRNTFLSSILEFLAPFLKVIGWILLGVLVLGLGLLLFLMFGDLRLKNNWFGRAKNATPDTDQNGTNDEEPLWSRDALTQADKLASRGAYSQAIHVLLLGSFGDLKARRAAQIPPSLTSREIIKQFNMPARAQTALSLLIGSVEISHFGGQDASKPIFVSCRDAFLLFAEPEDGKS